MIHSSKPDLSIIIVNWNTADHLERCLASIVQSANADSVDVAVVDNASSDASVSVVESKFAGVRLIRNRANVGFTRASNQGILASAGRYVLLLNSDSVVARGALAALVGFMDKHPDAGACGPRLVRPDGTIQPYGFGGDPSLSYLLARGLRRLLFGRPLHDWAIDEVHSVDWVSGACIILRREALNKVGLLDEGFFMYFEDNDLCLRLRERGWRVYYNPDVSVIHLGGQSLAQNPEAPEAYYRSLDHFYSKHYGPVARAVMRVWLLVYRLATRRD